MVSHEGLLQRIVSLALVTCGAFLWQSYIDNIVLVQSLQAQIGLPSLYLAVPEQVWPPSQRSAPFLVALILCFAVLVKRTFFSSTTSAECKRVHEVKKRLLLAQMTQAIRWNIDEPVEEEEKDKAKGDKDNEKEKSKKPPLAKDLFEMVYDDVEERHVTDYGIPANEEPYVSARALFEQRLAADFADFTNFTKLARREASGETIDFTGMDNDTVKNIPQYVDGAKLIELITLYKRKIAKAFGKAILDKNLLVQAEECQRELIKEQRKGMAMLWPILRPVLPMYFLAVSLMIFDASNGTVVFHSMKTLLDQVGSGSVTMEELKAASLQTYVKFIFCVFAHLTSWAFTHKATAKFRLKVRNQIMATIVRQDMKYFDLYPSGILQERLNNDAEQLSSKMFQLPIRLVDSFFRLLSCVFMLYGLDPKLFYVVALPVPLIAVSSHFIIRYMRNLGQRQRKIGEHVAANTMEVLKEIRTVREFNMESEEAEKFAASSAYRAEIEQYASAVHHIILIAPLCCLMEGMRFFATYLGGSFVAEGTMTPGQAVMAAGLAGDMTHIIRHFFDIIPEIVSTLQPLGRVCDTLSSTPKIEPCPGQEPKLKPEKFLGAIEFRQVNFTFPSEPLKQVLFDLSYSVKPGEKVGFVGGTGCGKSTSLYLLQRWYNPTSGTILLDGRDIREYDVHHLRQHMSVVAQATCLFSTTIRENIIYGFPQDVRAKITDEQIETALRQANAWDFVNDFPRKLETYAGERGVKLSGGQKQRLAIARAIIRKPTIVLLDEATSALDSKAEVVVQEALDKMIEEQENGCTLIIAHRLSTLSRCDRIILMDKGHIKESGSHKELMGIEVVKDADGKMVTGWYRDLYETQHGKDDDKKVEELRSSLDRTKQQLASLMEENSQLRVGTLMKTCKIARSLHFEQLSASEQFDTDKGLLSTNKVAEKENMPPPPPMLCLARASTHH